MYALISGSLPFDSNSERETKRMTVEEPVVFSERAWLKVSNPCKDLMSKLLMKDPAKRISLANAMNHKFFKGVSPND